MTSRTDPFERWSLTPVINASGTMTAIGASRADAEARAVVAAILDRFVSMDELQARASGVIAGATGAEAGCVTGCAMAGITQAVAAAMTGPDLAAIERLPETAERERRVLVQAGHLINFGARVDQTVALAGAKVVPLGTAALCETWHLRAGLAEGCAAALYVISHHTVREGELPLDLFIAICHEHDVPVIVDMAAEYDLTSAIALGADAVIWSGHKFLGGPTSGIVAGTLKVIRATYLQSHGIGRAMKAGKEAVAGAMAALEAWEKRPHGEERAREEAIVDRWAEDLERLPGLASQRVADWTGNPVTRLRIALRPEDAGLYAWELAERLAARVPKIIVRDDLAEHGDIYLDPCNVTEEEAEAVSYAIAEELDAARRRGDGLKTTWSTVKAERAAKMMAWPGGGDGTA